GSVTFTGISTDIMKLWDFPPEQAHGNTGEIIDGALTVASGFTGMVPYVGGIISGPINIARGVNMIIDASDINVYGGPGFNGGAFQGDVYQWGQNLNSAWTESANTLSPVADLLVSDAGRLTAALALVNTAGTDGVCADDLSIRCTPPSSCQDSPCLPGWGL